MINEMLRQYIINRVFENHIADLLQKKLIKGPVYLSQGQDHIPALIAQHVKDKVALFPQHRCHSWLLSFSDESDIESIAREICGLKGGINNGMGGSASLANPKKKIFGHSGLLGDQIPIAVGYAYATQQPTLCILGDAAAEEDYCLGALGQAVTLRAPIIFIVEDNNLSILTEKKVRRSWNIATVALAMGLCAYDIGDSFNNINSAFSLAKEDVYKLNIPALININTHRHLWHAGYGVDSPPPYDYFKLIDKHGSYLFVKSLIDGIFSDIEKELKIKYGA